MLFKMPRLDWIILTCCRDPHWTGFEMCEDYYARARKDLQLFCSLLRFLKFVLWPPCCRCHRALFKSLLSVTRQTDRQRYYGRKRWI